MIQYITEHFAEHEFACQCYRHEVRDGYRVLDHVIDKRLVDLLERIRERVGEPVHISSGYRCPEHNAEVGGVPNSQHVLGTAADIWCDSTSVDQLADIAREEGAGGVGRYYGQGFVHVDVRDYEADWDDQ